MSHLDPEQLALLALGEPVASDAEREHLASCPVCAADVSEMMHAATVARSTMDEMELDAPPAGVWDRIAAELGLSSAVAADPVGAAAEATATDAEPGTLTEPKLDEPGGLGADQPAERSQPGSEAAAMRAEAPAEPEPPRSRRPRRSLRAVWVLAASIALIVAVGAGLWTGLSNLAPTSIATASLDAFPDHPQAVGKAEVDQTRDGTRSLTVTLEGDAGSGDYREVWLIRNDGSALISLGVLEGDKGTFPIPSGVDLSEYDLVDISFEPIDGDPSHSGDSIVRGQLEFA